MPNDYLDVHEHFSFADFLAQTISEGLYEKTYDEIISENILSAAELEKAYQTYAKVIFIDLSKKKIVLDEFDQLPEKNAYNLSAVVLDKNNEGYVVGFINPFDEENVSNASAILNAFVTPVMVERSHLRRFLRLIYRKVESVQRFAASINVDDLETEVSLVDSMQDNDVASLVNLIIQDAYEINASDIHIETNKESLTVRLRIDGVLQEYSLDNLGLGSHIVRYLKIMSDIDITQEQIPCDGRNVSVWFKKKEVNLRISFFPTYFGQSVVIRLLGESASYSLHDKIKDPHYLQAIKNYLNKTYGMFVISGPTGSGKTTTLYSAIRAIDSIERNIITLEDPVEACIPSINQVQINEALGYGFAEGIRAAMRQDPDVIMIGEIRDEQTANLAIRAAITGHMVLASVHTRNVIEIPIRLINLNVDPFLLASALRLNVSQRLVRKICPNCHEQHQLNAAEQAQAERFYGNAVPTLYRGVGCHYCQGVGNVGREAVCEMLLLTDEMINALADKDISRYVQQANSALKGNTLVDNGLALAAKGVCSLSEVAKLDVS